MKKTHIFLVLAAISMCFQSTVHAQALGYNNNRIACSADGNNQPDLEYTGTYNTADPDDWGATPMALAILAKAKLQNQLVHYSYNNFMPSPPHTTEINYMKRNAEDAVNRFKFNGDVFFDVGTQKEEALLSLKDELIKSTADDPLYFIHMGPSEFFYQAVDSVVKAGGIESLSHVYIISHSGYNDNHLRRDTEHTMEQAITLSGNRINYKKIKDQNTCETPWLGLCSNKGFYHWQFLRDHRDTNLVWLWDRIQDHKHNKADVSDAGMVYYLLTGDENGQPSKLNTFFNYGILLPGQEIIETIDITEESLTIFTKRRYQLMYTTVPAEPWDDFMTWTTSNAEVAYVSPAGNLVGVAPGAATITVTAGIGNKTSTVNVVVIDDSNCDDCTETCDLIEKDGLLVFEAERFNLKGQWKVVEGDNYASGGKYITYTGANSYTSPNLSNEISYTFPITNSGTYTVKWFMRQPEEAEGDKSNDIWIYLDGDLGYGGSEKLTDYQKFVGRSKIVFAMNGQLDLHDHQPTLTAKFNSPGEYTLKVCGRSEHLQIDKFVLYKGLSGDDAIFKASDVTETTTCMDDVIDGNAEYEPLTGISLSENQYDLEVGDSEDISVTYTPANASNKVVKLTSQAPGIVSVEGNTITAVSAGTATISVESMEGDFSETINVTVTDNSTSILRIKGENLRVYPNPTNDKLYFSTITNLNKVGILSISGQVLVSKVITDSFIDVSNLENGMYFLRVYSEENENHVVSFVKR